MAASSSSPVPMTYLDSAPLPSMPGDQMPTSRKAQVLVQNPEWNSSGYQTPGKAPVPQFIFQTQDVPLSQQDQTNFQVKEAELENRYNAEAEQNNSLFAAIRSRRTTGSGNSNRSLLTGASPLASAVAASAVTAPPAKTLLGQ